MQCDHMTAMQFSIPPFCFQSHGGRTVAVHSWSCSCKCLTDSNMRPSFTRNVIPWMNSTAVSVSQANNGDHQVNSGVIQVNEHAVLSSMSPSPGSSIQARLATFFPIVASNQTSRKSTSRRPVSSKETINSNQRPSKTLVHKDLVIIHSPKIK